jgi:hypothetical protein
VPVLRRTIEVSFAQAVIAPWNFKITQINGKREQFEGKIQERYGTAKDQVRKDVDTWLNSAD